MDERMNPIQADGRIAMLYGSAFERGRFDATRWFKDGMYRLRYSAEMPSDLTMLRESIPPIPDSELEDLRAWLVVGLNPNDPYFSEEYGLKKPHESYIKVLMDRNFDPRSQLIYHPSYFREIDKPRDMYTAYLLIEGERYFVGIERDAMTGKIVTASRKTHTSVHADKTRRDWLFKRLEERQKKQLPPSKDTEFPAAALEKNPCPKTGYWWTPGVEGERYFEKGERMPVIEAGYGQAIWYRVQE